MPKSKNQLLRYRVIDEALRESFKAGKNGVSKKELMRKIAIALNGEEGAYLDEEEKFEHGISKRTLYYDIQYLKKIGAPIETDMFQDGAHYYFYMTSFAFGESIGKDELARLYRARAALAQLGLSGLSDQLEEIITVAKEKLKHVELPQGFPIQLENRELKGLEHLTLLLDAIVLPQKPDLLISYNPYNSETLEIACRPVFLKEFNRRWYLVAVERKKQRIVNLALDRMQGFEQTKFSNMPDVDLKAIAKRYEKVIGLTIDAEAPTAKEILLKLSPGRAPYVLTKPLHSSQKVARQEPDGTTISLEVVINKELEAKVLELGRDAEVLAPESFREQIKETLKQALNQY